MGRGISRVSSWVTQTIDRGRRESNTKEKQHEVDYDIQEMVKDYADIFQTPKNIPNRRHVDHRITLREQNSINVRPYKYAHIQKE